MEKAFELGREIEILEDEMDKSVEEYVKENPQLLNKELPFEGLPDTKYTINEVTVKNLSTSYLSAKFSLTVDEDLKNKYGGVEKSLLIYFKAIDSNEEDIPEALSVATSFGGREPLVAGANYEATGSIKIEKLENFSKIVQISKEEYEEKK